MVVSDGMRVVEGVWLDVFFIDFLNRLARALNRSGVMLLKPRTPSRLDKVDSVVFEDVALVYSKQLKKNTRDLNEPLNISDRKVWYVNND